MNGPEALLNNSRLTVCLQAWKMITRYTQLPTSCSRSIGTVSRAHYVRFIRQTVEINRSQRANVPWLSRANNIAAIRAITGLCLNHCSSGRTTPFADHLCLAHCTGNRCSSGRRVHCSTYPTHFFSLRCLRLPRDNRQSHSRTRIGSQPRQRGG